MVIAIMSNDPTHNKAVANRFIQKYGRTVSVTITRAVNTAYSTTQLTSTIGTPLTWLVYACPLDYAAIRFNDLSQKAGFNDATRVKELYVPGGIGPDGQTYIPQIGDTVALDSVWTVLAIKDTFETGGVACAYLLHIGA